MLERVKYRRLLVRRTSIANPIDEFKSWFSAAAQAGIKEPNAMTLATATKSGKPSARIVLLKGVDRDGFVFFTNYESRKGRELAQNARAALVFYWEPLGRQVRVTGRVSKVSAAESDAYFASRPLGSRYSAAVSAQSRVIKSRADLEQRLAKMKEKYRDAGPPRPKYWGGYRVRPEEIEFWQQGEFRLHHRVRFRRRGSSWLMDILSP